MAVGTGIGAHAQAAPPKRQGARRRAGLSAPDAPRFSISQVSTLRASFVEDVRAFAAEGVDGIGIWETKLPEGGEAEALEALESSGLGPASAVPTVPSILPLPLMEGPADPAERIESICRSLHRLAPFRPSGIVCLTGSAVGRDADAARDTVVDGLQTIAAEACRLGLRIALEPYQRESGEPWTIVSSIPEALALIGDAGEPAGLGIQFDIWHLWNTPTLHEDIRAHVGRFAGVHVCDVRGHTRGWADRVLPGDGVANVPAILSSLREAGWKGYYDLEIFSDDGTFGSVYQDSLWALDPSELARRGRESFARCWEERRVAA